MKQWRLTGTKFGDCHEYQKHHGKIHSVTLTGMGMVLGLHANLFSVT